MDWIKPYVFEFFKPDELLSPDGMIQFCAGNLLIQPAFVYKLVGWRASEEKAFFINHANLFYRGFRSGRENDQIKGATFSRHIQGIAADITIAGLSVGEMKESAEKRGFPFVKAYYEKGFIHVDDRPKLL